MPSERELALQAELQQLKAALGQLRIRRAPPGAPGAPFPIQVSAPLDAPPGGRIDAEQLTVTLQLQSSILSPPPARADAVTVSVSGNPPLPPRLAAEIGTRLHAAWAAAAASAAAAGSGGGRGGFGVAATVEAARRQFWVLLGSVPECLEPYEGVDGNGATQRRFAVVAPTPEEDSPPAAPAAAAAVEGGQAAAGVAAAAVAAAADPADAKPAATAAAPRAATPPTAAAAAAVGVPSHPATRRPIVPRPPVARPQRAAAPGAPVDAAAAELRWVTARFGSALRLEGCGSSGQPPAGEQNTQQQQQQQQQQGPRGFSLMLQPTDPSWGSRGPVHVTGTVGPAATASTTNGNGSDKNSSSGSGGVALRVMPTIGVPRDDAARLETELRQRASEAVAAANGGCGLGLRAALLWLEGYAGSALAAPPLAAAGAARGPVASGGEGPSSSGSGGDGSSEDPTSGSYSSSWDDEYESDGSAEEGEEQEGEGEGAAPQAGGHSGDAHSGGGAAFGVSLEGMQLDMIDALEILDAHIQLRCARCGGDGGGATAALAPGPGGGRAWEWRGACGRCAAPLWAGLRPKICHEASNEIGALKTEGCAPVDLLPSLFGAQCGDCSASVALRGVQVGLPSSRNCPYCHKQLTLLIPSVAFIPKRPPGAGGAGAAAAARRRAPRAGGGGGARGEPAVVVGQPLPATGTCHHYRHSHRWLRFPCCGRRFPCDLCHELGTDGHDMAWAKRMTCGYCSVEQAVASACTACGKKVTTSSSNPSGRATRFWEGGAGCRDPSSMSRKDPHRYRNSKAKTRSAKSKRVGPKPWS